MKYDRILLVLLSDVEELKVRVAQLEAERAASTISSAPSTLPPGQGKGMGFVEYLTSVKGMKQSTANTRASNFRRVARYEGSLEDAYAADQGEALLERLSYTMEDRIHSRPARHKVPISGALFTGTATLRQAVLLYFGYIDFSIRP